MGMYSEQLRQRAEKLGYVTSRKRRYDKLLFRVLQVALILALFMGCCIMGAVIINLIFV